MDSDQKANKFRIAVSRPDWLKDAFSAERTFLRLANADKIPLSLLGYMTVTHCKRMLRAVYGSDQGAASALAQHVIDDMLDAQNQMLCEHSWVEIASELEIAQCEKCGCVRDAHIVCTHTRLEDANA